MHKRNRIALRADKAWRSVWLRQMLMGSKTSRSIDNSLGYLSYGEVSSLRCTNSTVGSSDTKPSKENKNDMDY
jgi:hypothetical protein